MPPYSVVRVSPPLDVTIPGCAVLLSVLTLFCYIPQPRGAGVLPDCAVCYDGYGSGVSNSCHPCDDTKAHLLIAMGVLFCLVLLLLLFLAIVFLIGGLDAIDIVRQTVSRKVPFGSNASANGIPVPVLSSQGRKLPQLGTRNDSVEATIVPSAHDSAPKLNRGGYGVTSRDRMLQSGYSETSEVGSTDGQRLGAAVGVGAVVALSGPLHRYNTGDGGAPARHPALSLIHI